MTNWSIPQRRRLVIVRRRIGTPPTGKSVFGVSSEYGRSRVAQPAARMTAFTAPRVCKRDARYLTTTWNYDLFNFHQVPNGSTRNRPNPVTVSSSERFVTVGEARDLALHIQVGRDRDR